MEGGAAARDAFLASIDFRYQKSFGNVTLVTALSWLGVMGGAWYAMRFGWPLVLVGIGTGLLALFTMRTVVHLRGALLCDEVDAFAQEHETTLAELIAAAKARRPPAEFFVSLVDGPLARHRRQGAADRASQAPPH